MDALSIAHLALGLVANYPFVAASLAIVGYAFWLRFTSPKQRTAKQRKRNEAAGKKGESKVVQAVTAAGFRCVNGIIFRHGKYIVQADVVVDLGGRLAVVEVKNYGGDVYGSEWDKKWRQVMKNKMSRFFQSPLCQSRWHAKAISEFYGLRCTPLVCFAGDAMFPKIPRETVSLEELPSMLKSLADIGTTPAMTWTAIENAACDKNPELLAEHIREKRNKYGDD